MQYSGSIKRDKRNGGIFEGPVIKTRESPHNNQSKGNRLKNLRKLASWWPNETDGQLDETLQEDLDEVIAVKED